jgi:hypothetical protein
MTSKSSMQMVGHNLNNDRNKNDFYPTPPEATLALLNKQKFEGNIWECACGDGAISKILIDEGYDVYSSDLIDRNYGDVGLDFLESNKKYDNIITNPPFKLSLEFTLKALSCVNNKAVFLHKLTYLEGIKRYQNIFNLNKLEKVLIFSRRLGFKKNDKKGGLMCFAWFIFDVNYNGKPQIDWI